MIFNIMKSLAVEIIPLLKKEILFYRRKSFTNNNN